MTNKSKGAGRDDRIHARPCAGCPYRRDCPSGVWDRSEYEKLAEYDRETFEQPIGVFLCHDADRKTTMCRGWLDAHDKSQLLALRLAVGSGQVSPDVFDLPKSPVPCFESGTEAMQHGLQRIKRPRKDAVAMQEKLVARHPDLLGKPRKKRKS